MKKVKFQKAISKVGIAFFIFLTLGIENFIFAQSFSLVGCKASHESGNFDVFKNELLYNYNGYDICGITINTFGIWNNLNWKPFPNSFDSINTGNLNAFKLYKNSLYAGGNFYIIGGKITNSIARWNGLQWDSVGKGLDEQFLMDEIKAMEIYQNKLYVGGYFRRVDGVAGYNNIAVWDGATWSKIPGTFGSYPLINCMAVYKGELYIGGYFTQVGTSPANHIARWNGSKWKTVGKGVNGGVSAMVVDTIKNILYLSGNFNAINDTIKCKVAQWDGSKLSVVGDPKIFASRAGALEMYHGYLFAGGDPIRLGQTDTVLARWDGIKWDVFLGIDGPVSSLKTYQDELYLGGAFTKILNDSISYLARYYSPDTVATAVPASKPPADFLIFPNPAGTKITIQSSSQFSKFIILDIQGKKVLELNNPQSNTIDVSELKKGGYFLKGITKKKEEWTERFEKE